jgi:hypothetical protein
MLVDIDEDAGEVTCTVVNTYVGSIPPQPAQSLELVVERTRGGESPSSDWKVWASGPVEVQSPGGAVEPGRYRLLSSRTEQDTDEGYVDEWDCGEVPVSVSLRGGATVDVGAHAGTVICTVVYRQVGPPEPVVFAVLDEIVDGGQVTDVPCGVDEFVYRVRLYNRSAEPVVIVPDPERDNPIITSGRAFVFDLEIPSQLVLGKLPQDVMLAPRGRPHSSAELEFPVTVRPEHDRDSEESLRAEFNLLNHPAGLGQVGGGEGEPPRGAVEGDLEEPTILEACVVEP